MQLVSRYEYGTTGWFISYFLVALAFIRIFNAYYFTFVSFVSFVSFLVVSRIRVIGAVKRSCGCLQIDLTYQQMIVSILLNLGSTH
jgi:hypothetical protein